MKTLVLVVLLVALLAATHAALALGPTDYPFGNADVADPWLFLTRQSTSYAAWYWNVLLGRNWYNTQPGRGSARYWDEIARTLGYTVSSSPQVGAVVAWRGPLFAGDMWGHVAIVEGVNSDGTINISEMNWVPYSYSYRTGVRPGDFGAYYYIFPVPEPSSFLALIGAVATLGILKRR